MLLTFNVNAQDISAYVVNDISNVSTEFETAFYQALSHRLISNHQKAITFLEKCEDETKEKPVVYFELGRNYFETKHFEQAKINFEKADKMMPNDEAILDELRRTYFSLQDYNKNIATIKKLIQINPRYKLELAKSYMYTQQFAEALNELDTYQSIFGYELQIDKIRERIYKFSKDKSHVIIDLEKSLKRNPKNEQAYLELINVYKNLNKEAEALKVLERLQTNVKSSNYLDYIKFEEHVQNGDTEAATKLMTDLVERPSIDEKLKSKVIEKYRVFASQNPNFKKELYRSEVSDNTSQDANMKVFMELANYQIQTGKTEELLKVYESSLDTDPNNYKLLKDTLLLQLYYGKTQEANELIKIALDKYPAQPLLYLIKGTLLSKTNHHKAISAFSDGLDYLVDDPALEKAFYLKLYESHIANGNTEKANKYKLKSEKINVN